MINDTSKKVIKRTKNSLHIIFSKIHQLVTVSEKNNQVKDICTERKEMFNSFYFSELGMTPRAFPRAPHLRQESYEELFDNDTLIYDIVFNGKELVFISPILTKEASNSILENSILNNKILSDYNVKSYTTSRTHKFIIKIEHIVSLLVFDRKIILSNDLHSTCDASRVLYTHQKNNSLVWIKDWVNYYTKFHNPSVIIIYDNNSDIYTVSELQNYLDNNTKCECIVKSFPFKMGPGAYKGSDWDSDFGQYAAFEHIRYSLKDPQGFLNVDIDELLVTDNKISIFEILSKTNKTVVLFKGRWAYVDNAINEDMKNIRHHMHSILENDARCPLKYAVKLNKLNNETLLGVHGVYNIENKTILDTAEYLHCYNISTGWKNYRGDGAKLDEKINFQRSLYNLF